jgi:hypothetical protein
MNKKSWLVYCVTQGLTGCYMPDNVEYITNKKEALSYAASLARDCRDDGYKVSGNAWDGYYYAWPDQFDDTAYNISIGVMVFSTKAERDQFISQNSDF